MIPRLSGDCEGRERIRRNNSLKILRSNASLGASGAPDRFPLTQSAEPVQGNQSGPFDGKVMGGPTLDDVQTSARESSNSLDARRS